MAQATQTEKSFVYMATKPGGGRAMGVRRARNRRALAELLRKDRLVVRQTWTLPDWLGSDEGFTLNDVAAFNDQLSRLTARGVPLVEALEVTGSVVRPQAWPIDQRMREMVAAGSGFSEACSKLNAFDPVTIAIYRAAERTGDVSGATAQIAKSVRRQLAVKDQAVTLLIYPIVVMTISAGAVSALLMFVVPTIGEALAQTGQDLPWFTDALVFVGNWMKGNWLILLGMLALAAVLGILGRRVLGRVLAGVLRTLPVMKDVVLTQESARFFTVMAAMTRAGIPLADALAVGVEALSHPRLRAELDRLRVRLIQGGVFRTLVEQVTMLPLSVRRLVIAADRAGDLETAFDSLAEDMADDVEKKTTRLLALLEPALIVLMFLVIGSVIMAVMLPIITISSQGF